MGKLVDSDAVIAMLQAESVEWNAKASAVEDVTYKSYLSGIASGYTAAATDIAAMVKSQAEGNVPTGEVE